MPNYGCNYKVLHMGTLYVWIYNFICSQPTPSARFNKEQILLTITFNIHLHWMFIDKMYN